MRMKKSVVGLTGGLLIAGLWFKAALADHTPWHTPPDKWQEPRVYHTPFEESYSGRIKIGKGSLGVQRAEKSWSRNKAYFFIVSPPDFGKGGPWDTVISIYNERDYFVQISLMDHGNCHPKIDWINEKLLYIEVWWGRILGTTIVFDVERETIIHKEMVHWGAIAFQQWREGMQKQKQP